MSPQFMDQSLQLVGAALDLRHALFELDGLITTFCNFTMASDEEQLSVHVVDDGT
ncbi:hypothetical protein [Cerasicoccus arenae]|uniref:hypothetical protein n=1 Tax=Cerasicoccus arenae TaxID=424488 RepID=UPI00167A57D0|nr:hypothetical protein [Cerasicoccus arenae]MBK1856996.1 hypothetical protein [Cerasicoccus arenae]